MGISGTCHGEGEARIQWVDKAILTSRYFRSLLSCTVWKTCSWRLCPAWPPSTAFLQLDTRRDRSTYGSNCLSLRPPGAVQNDHRGPGPLLNPRCHLQLILVQLSLLISRQRLPTARRSKRVKKMAAISGFGAPRFHEKPPNSRRSLI